MFPAIKQTVIASYASDNSTPSTARQCQSPPKSIKFRMNIVRVLVSYQVLRCDRRLKRVHSLPYCRQFFSCLFVAHTQINDDDDDDKFVWQQNPFVSSSIPIIAAVRCDFITIAMQYMHVQCAQHIDAAFVARKNLRSFCRKVFAHGKQKQIMIIIHLARQTFSTHFHAIKRYFARKYIH